MCAQWHVVDAFPNCESQACKLSNLPMLTRLTKVLDDGQCSPRYMMTVRDDTQQLDFGLQLQAL